MNNEVLKKNNNEQYVQLIADFTDEEGLRLAYETKDGLYQHYNKSFVAGTKDFPRDHTDDFKLPFDYTLTKTYRGRTADAYYRSHHEADTVIGHSLGGAVALSLEKQYDKAGNNPYGIVQSKTFGSPTVSGDFSGTNPKRTRWAGDPISALGFNSTTVTPSSKQRFNNSAHSYCGLFIKDAVPVHDTMHNPLERPPDDRNAEVITY